MSLTAADQDDRVHARSRSGFALVLVIWGIGLIALLTLTILEVVHFRSIAAANLSAGLRAEAMAEAGVALVVLDRIRLIAEHQTSGERYPADGRPRLCSMPEQGISALTVEDEAGKVDLNAAQPNLLGALLVNLGLESTRAGAIAAAIVAFRSPSPDPRTDAAERAAYAKAGRPAGPKRAPFRTSLELGQVIGITPELLDSLLPLVTVYSGREIPDIAVAPPLLATVLRRDVETMPSYRDVLLVRSEAEVSGGGFFDREAVVRFTGGGRRPYLILEWRRGTRRNAALLDDQRKREATTGGATLPAC